MTLKQVAIAATVCAAIALLLAAQRVVGQTRAAEPSRLEESTPATLALGRRIYDANCAVCHGADGAGNGPAASMFFTRPRDFRSGIFKFRSTPSGSLPTDEDLFRTITYGLRWTGMIARPDLTDSERRAVVQFVKTFSRRFADEKPAPPVLVASRPATSAERIAHGEKLFRDAGCDSCHGSGGRGDGSSAPDLQDDWGRASQPGDLTWRPLKRGSSLDQIYLTIATGVSGTPMPAFGASIHPAQIWSLVYYLETLVPADHRLADNRLLGEEQQGRMALHMSGMMGRGRGTFAR